ncbi:MAG: bacterio-opsin activator domain-containing protein [Natrialbaceae archaeon]|nr:bacterio-opsin activator domain-containing protein [Natrialbaceae archaeon]
MIVLESLASTVATAINGLEARRLLVTDSVIELALTIDDDSLGLVALAEQVGEPVRYRGLRHEAGEARVFVRLESETSADIRSVAGLESVTVLAEGERFMVLELVVADDLVPMLSEHGAAVRQLDATDSTLSVELDVPTESAARTLFDGLSERFSGVQLTSYQTRERPVQSIQELAGDLLGGLTDQQADALRRAFHAGYYEWPRDASAEELAATMDITRQTFHQHLRAGERKLIGGILSGDRSSLGM